MLFVYKLIFFLSGLWSAMSLPNRVLESNADDVIIINSFLAFENDSVESYNDVAFH